MRLLLDVVRGEGHGNPRDVLRLDVLDDRAEGAPGHQRQPETAVQESVEVSRPDARRIGDDLDRVLRRPHPAHLRMRVRHPADGSRARHQRRVFLDPQMREPGGGGVGLLQKIGVGEVRVQHGAARQERHAVSGVGNVIPYELWPVVDAALVPVRQAAQVGAGHGQALQQHLGFHRARQVRPAVEPPALPLQPSAGNELLLHGPHRTLSTKDHPAGAVIRDPNPREHPATGSAPPVEGHAPPAGAFSPPGSGDVQKDVRVAPVLRHRSRCDVPPVLFGVPNLQNGPPVESPVGPSVPRPLPGPCSQFIDRRTIHPVHRDRLGLFAFQKDAVVDDAFERAIANLAVKRGSAEILVRIQLRRRRLGRSRPRVHHVNGRLVDGSAVQDGENPAPGVETPARGGARRHN